MTDFMDINDDPHLDIDSSRRSLLNNNDNLDLLPNLLSDSGDELPEKHYVRRQSTRRKSLRKSVMKRRNPTRDYLKLFIPGVVVMLLGVILYAIDPFNLIIDIFFNLREGSLIYNLWRYPPLKVYIKVYVFNVTNGARFIRGTDPKLKIDEVGPYVYSDQLSHNDIMFYENGTLSFIGKHNLTFEPDLSIGDPKVDQINVTNVAFLAIASKVFNKPSAVLLGLNTAIRYVNPPVIMNMTVHEFLWGYDEPLVKLGSKLFPSWLNFEKVGILDRMFDEGDNRITIAAGSEKRFRAEKMNGSPGLSDWGYKPDVDRGKCDIINGTYDGILFSPNPPDKIFVYRKLLCRPFPLVYDNNENAESANGVPVKQYTLSDDALLNENPDNKCYCYDKSGCFPSGVSDFSPCYFGIPVGMSLPHFYGADPALYKKIDGIKPDKERHKTLLQIQPDIGIPMYGKIPIQLNVLVRKTRMIPKVKPFNDMVVPLFWVEVVLEGLPPYLDNLVWCLMVLLPPSQITLIVSSIIGGLALVLAANLRYVIHSKPWDRGFSTRKRASIISHKIKQETRRLSTKSQHFIPLSTVEAPRARS